MFVCNVLSKKPNKLIKTGSTIDMIKIFFFLMTIRSNINNLVEFGLQKKKKLVLLFSHFLVSSLALIVFFCFSSIAIFFSSCLDASTVICFAAVDIADGGGIVNRNKNKTRRSYLVSSLFNFFNCHLLFN